MKVTEADKQKIQSLEKAADSLGLELDIESLRLTPQKEQVDEPAWLIKWKDQRDQADNLPDSPEQAGW